MHDLLLTPGGGWTYADLTRAVPAAPTVSGSISSYVSGTAVGVLYRTSDGHIHQLVNDSRGNWSEHDISVAAGIASAGGSLPREKSRVRDY